MFLVTTTFLLPYAIGSPAISSTGGNRTVNQSGDSGQSVNSTVVPPEEIATFHSRNSSVTVISDVSSSKTQGLHKTGGCHVKVYAETLSYNRCLNRIVLLRGCQGGCTSYFIPVLANKGRLQQKCRCCKASTRRKGWVTLRCPRDPVFKKQHVVVRGAKSCHCRPCSSFRKTSFDSFL